MELGGIYRFENFGTLSDSKQFTRRCVSLSLTHTSTHAHIQLFSHISVHNYIPSVPWRRLDFVHCTSISHTKLP